MKDDNIKQFALTTAINMGLGTDIAHLLAAARKIEAYLLTDTDRAATDHFEGEWQVLQGQIADANAINTAANRSAFVREERDQRSAKLNARVMKKKGRGPDKKPRKVAKRAKTRKIDGRTAAGKRAAIMAEKKRLYMIEFRQGLRRRSANGAARHVSQ